MLIVKSPWNSKTVGSVKKNNAKELEIILNKVSQISRLKGIDFPIKDRIKVLNNFKERIQNDLNSEFIEAKNQVKKIASFRLKDILSN